jgi:Cu2+-exporting ATPase
VIPGRGVVGRIEGLDLALGSLSHPPIDADPRIMARLRADDQDASVALFRSGSPLAVFYFDEQLRPDTEETLATLRRLGMHLELLSGDRQAPGLVPRSFHVFEAHLGMLPEEKLARVRGWHGHGVAMVGDGLNDAPALAAADVGIAVAAATDVTRLNADVAMLRDRLEAIPWLLRHGKRVNRIVRQNLIWAFGYNSLALLFAVQGKLNPVIASLVMLASSAAVVANSRRLAR